MAEDISIPEHRPRVSGGRFGHVDMATFSSPRLSKNLKLVYAAIAGHADPNGLCWPGRELLARETGLTVRSVEKATKEAEDIGLLIVVRGRFDPKTGQSEKNHYYLCDWGRGFIPELVDEGANQVRPPNGGRTRFAGEGERGSPEHDHINITIHADRGHSSEGTPGAPAPNGGRRAPSQLRLVEPEPQPVEQIAKTSKAPRPKKVVVLGRPKGLYRRTPDAARAYACRAVIAAAKKAGRPLGQNAAGPLDYHLRSHVCADMTNHQLVSRAEEVVNLAMHGDPIWRHLFEDEVRLPREVGPDTLEALHEELDGYVGGETTVDSMWYRGRRPAEIYNTVIKQNGATA